MAISRAVYVTCDHCGMPGPVECFHGAAGARQAARSEAGFTRQRRKGEPALDLCRECTIKYEEGR